MRDFPCEASFRLPPQNPNKPREQLRAKIQQFHPQTVTRRSSPSVHSMNPPKVHARE